MKTIREQFGTNPPLGEVLEYGNDFRFAKNRTSEIETNQAGSDYEQVWKDHREAAECHRQVRKAAREIIKPGIKIEQLCNDMEKLTRDLIGADGLNAGLVFPFGVSKNFIVAHFAPVPGDQMTLEEDDIFSIDFGIHRNGRIVDSAFSMAFNPIYDALLEVVREATEVGIKTAGIDVLVNEVGEAIQEVYDSKGDILFGNEKIKIKPVRNLGGHNIEQYEIHAKKTVPIVRDHFQREAFENIRMLENEVFAIETFGSTGDGLVRYAKPNSHFTAEKIEETKLAALPQSGQDLYKLLRAKFRSFCFTQRHLEFENIDYTFLEDLVSSDVIRAHPPLVDTPGSASAQFEHTILLRPECKEVVTRGTDY